MNEWMIIKTGRRVDDVWCAMARDGRRLCFHTPVDYSFGRELEHLTKDQRLRTHGVVVWNQKWKSFYVVARHLGWVIEDYFTHAETLFKEQKIEP